MTLRRVITQLVTFSCIQPPCHVLLALYHSGNTSHYVARSSKVSVIGLENVRSGSIPCYNPIFSWWCLGNVANNQNQDSWFVGGRSKCASRRVKFSRLNSTPVCSVSSVPFCSITSTPVCSFSCVPFCSITSTPVCSVSSIPFCSVASTPVCSFSSVPFCSVTSTPVCSVTSLPSAQLHSFRF
jgi:hypothetical protein